MSALPAGGAGAAGAGQVVRAAHLRKLKTMKKKFFVLRAETPECSARLEYYESEKKFRAGATPRRVIPLKSCYNITRRLDLKQKHVIALFTREEQFCIVAENEIDLHEWLTAILKQHRNDDASEELLHPIRKFTISYYFLESSRLQFRNPLEIFLIGLFTLVNSHSLYILTIINKAIDDT